MKLLLTPGAVSLSLLNQQYPDMFDDYITRFHDSLYSIQGARFDRVYLDFAFKDAGMIYCVRNMLTMNKPEKDGSPIYVGSPFNLHLDNYDCFYGII